MPPLETCRLHQKAVLWAFVGNDNYGDVTVSAAVEIDVRWETGNRESLDAQGNSIGINSVAVVDRVIAVGSIMWLGNLADIATPPVNLRQVSDNSEIPDLKSRKFRRVVSLVKYSNELPTIV